LGLLLTAAMLGTWAVASPDHLRHTAAKSLRDAIGPPQPPVELVINHIGDDDETAFADRTTTGQSVIIPHADAAAPATPRQPPDLSGVSFVLLLGADNRDAKVTGRTDTMMVGAFRHSDGKVAAFSVPRDLWIPLPDIGDLHDQGRTHARMSSVVRVGEVRLGPGQGLPLLRRILGEQLGVQIDRVASIDLAGFVGLVDDLGGIEVDVECPIKDCFWINGTDQPCDMLDIQAGRVRMDGATALKFARSRHGRGDHDRTRRQQAVMLGFARKVRAGGLRGLRDLWRQAEPFIKTDIATDDAAYYASFALDNELRDIRGFAIRHPMTARHVTEDGKHVMLLDRPAFDRALATMFDNELPAVRKPTRCADADAALSAR